MTQIDNLARPKTHAARIFPGTILLLWALAMLHLLASVPFFQSLGALMASLLLEGIPFLLVGTLLAGLVQAFLSPIFLPKIVRRLGVFSVPLIALSGFILPVCECAIVPTVRSLRRKGLPLSAAITFLLSAPLVNPIVIASTVAAFREQPEMIAGRFVGGYLIAVLIGYYFWVRERIYPEPPPPPAYEGSAEIDRTIPPFRARVRGALTHTVFDFTEVLGFFFFGAFLSSLAQIVVPADWYYQLHDQIVPAILTMIVAAFLLSLCSEADAFIGKAFMQLLPPSAVLAFLIFGPMLDLKNVILLRRVLKRSELIVLSTLLVCLVLIGGIIHAFFIA